MMTYMMVSIIHNITLSTMPPSIHLTKRVISLGKDHHLILCAIVPVSTLFRIRYSTIETPRQLTDCLITPFN